MSDPTLDAPTTWACFQCGVVLPEPPEKAHVCEEAARERHWRKLFAQGSGVVEAAMREKVRFIARDPTEFHDLSPEAQCLLALWVHFKG